MVAVDWAVVRLLLVQVPWMLTVPVAIGLLSTGGAVQGAELTGEVVEDPLH